MKSRGALIFKIMNSKQKERIHKIRHQENCLQIDELGWHGDGIANLEGKRIYVPFTLAGESVTARVMGSRARLLEVLSASPNRIDPLCKYYGKCGGCVAQHLKFEMYCQWKRQVIVNALSNRQIKAPVKHLIDGHGSGRRRVLLHVVRDNGQFRVGFMQARSHNLVEINSCPILVPELVKATEIARDIARCLLDTDRTLNIQLTLCDTGLDCHVVGKRELDLHTRINLSDCANSYDLARLSVGNDVILERRAPILTFGPGKVLLPLRSFLQATFAGEEILSNIVLDWVSGSKQIADLYCGLGPFSLRMAAYSSVTSFDNDALSILALRTAAKKIQGQKPVMANIRDLKENPLQKSELDNFDAVVFDPPRSGSISQARELATSEVPRVVAISCNAATFARDSSILIDGGYRLEKVVPVDQFRFASHVEIVGVFERA